MGYKKFFKELFLSYWIILAFNLLHMGWHLLFGNKDLIKIIFFWMIISFIFLPFLFFWNLLIKKRASGYFLFFISLNVLANIIPSMLSVFMMNFGVKNIFILLSTISFFWLYYRKTKEYYILLNSVFFDVFEKQPGKIFNIQEKKWMLTSFSQLEKYSKPLKNFLNMGWVQFLIPIAPAVGIFIGRYMSNFFQIYFVNFGLLTLLYLMIIITMNSVNYFVHLKQLQKELNIEFQVF